jgi:hypothetical protein
MSPEKHSKIQLTLGAIILSFATILLSGCVQRNTLQNKAHITFENTPSTTIDFTHLNVSNTIKGLNIKGSVINRLTWPKLRNNNVDIEVSSTDGELIEYISTPLHARRGRGQKKKIYDFSTLIEGDFNDDVHLHFTIKPSS